MVFENPILQYINRLIIAISILINVLTGGKSNQTFSARNYGWKLDGKPNLVWLIDRILFFDPDHCLNSWIFWVEIRKAYPEYIFR